MYLLKTLNALFILIIFGIFIERIGCFDLPSKIQLDKYGNFIDSAGRHCLFHGINSVNKGYPWYQPDMLNETRLNYFKEWGFNAVRLGMMWTGVMPQKDSFNETYIAIQERIIDLLAKYGMYSLLDMHQDVISTRYDSYDGVPRWLIDMFPQQKGPLKYPWPLKSPALGMDWANGYLTYAVGDAFQHLYSNTSNSLAYWAQFWRKVVTAYGKRNSIIGYELINEPWAGNIYLDPLRLLPGYAGKENLLPVYDYLVKEIRSLDNTTLVFYEPVTWGIYFAGGGNTGSGFNRVPGGEKESSRSVLSYHYYCWILQVPSASKPYPEWEQIVCDALLLKRMYEVTALDIKVTGGGRFLTEFGLCSPDNSSVSLNTVECDEVISQADDNLQSWTYWDSEFFNNITGDVYWTRVRSFARTYPRATAGSLQSIKFDIDTGAFHFVYSINSSILAPTEIFLPTSVHYKNGFSVTSQPNMTTSFSAAENILYVNQPTKGHLPDGTNVTVTITQKKSISNYNSF